jgi:hypothetical protein
VNVGRAGEREGGGAGEEDAGRGLHEDARAVKWGGYMGDEIVPNCTPLWHL